MKKIYNCQFKSNFVSISKQSQLKYNQGHPKKDW